MRKEQNALKDTTVQFGDLYVFEAHLCFDWKVFGFHKQQVLDLADVVALLKSSELPNTVEVQVKSASYELTIPEDFEAAWNIMESCRRNTQAHTLQRTRTRTPTPTLTLTLTLTLTQAMGARCRAARAVRRWSAAAAERRWARDARAVARQAHLALQRARRAAAVARGWALTPALALTLT